MSNENPSICSSLIVVGGQNRSKRFSRVSRMLWTEIEGNKCGEELMGLF
jgi:hypothetical protein